MSMKESDYIKARKLRASPKASESEAMQVETSLNADVPNVVTVSSAPLKTEETAQPTNPPKNKGGRPPVTWEKSTKRVSLLLPPSKFTKLDTEAKTRQTFVNALINEAIDLWLKENGL